jgi:hypothetical protein
MRHYLVVLGLLGLSCLSEERASDRWDAWVADHSSCVEDSDCALVYPGCPLGCASAVKASYVDEAQAKADKHIRRYERGGRMCDYKCIGASGPVCVDSRCDVEWMEH